MIDDASEDAICLEEPTCQWCGAICDRTEVVWTGDEDSYQGYELWCYCDKCKTDTFRPMSKLNKSK